MKKVSEGDFNVFFLNCFVLWREIIVWILYCLDLFNATLNSSNDFFLGFLFFFNKIRLFFRYKLISANDKLFLAEINLYLKNSLIFF